MSDVLTANDVAVSYGSHEALVGVSLSLAASQLQVMIGPNGSGKSTLLAALLGHVPSRGTIAWNDKPLAKWKPRALARVVAYLPQSPRSDVGQRVRDVLAIGRAPYWGAFGLES